MKIFEIQMNKACSGFRRIFFLRFKQIPGEKHYSLFFSIFGGVILVQYYNQQIGPGSLCIWSCDSSFLDICCTESPHLYQRISTIKLLTCQASPQLLILTLHNLTHLMGIIRKLGHLGVYKLWSGSVFKIKYFFCVCVCLLGHFHY